jgi:hypothetical protein
MASIAASAGKNSEPRRRAHSNETDVQVCALGVPEISASRSETMCQGVVEVWPRWKTCAKGTTSPTESAFVGIASCQLRLGEARSKLVVTVK